MPYQHKQNETLYKGRSRWLQVPMNYEPKPGENVIDTDNVIKKVDRNGFEITYLSYFFDLFDQLAGRKYAVVKYILQHKSSENTLIITNRELAKKCNVGINTVTETLKILREAGLIITRTGAIMINPKLAHRGKVGRERYLLQKFEEFGEENESNTRADTTSTADKSISLPNHASLRCGRAGSTWQNAPTCQ